MSGRFQSKYYKIKELFQIEKYLINKKREYAGYAKEVAILISRLITMVLMTIRNIIPKRITVAECVKITMNYKPYEISIITIEISLIKIASTIQSIIFIVLIVMVVVLYSMFLGL